MRGAVFDVDGVIVDVRKSYHHAIRETVKHFTGKELDLSFIREFKFSRGINNDWDVTYRLIEHLGNKPPPYEELVEVFENFYDRFKDREELILPPEFFARLKEEGVRLGVVTGRPRRDLSYLFDRFGLWEFFECIVDEDEVGDQNLRKPHPYPLHLCTECMGLEEGLYVGDNRADYEMVYFYRKLYGKPFKFVHFNRVHREDLPAHYRTGDPGELFRIILREVSPSREGVREFPP
ncbi:MAG: HAD-IA family hydrolase [Aquificae bacterium]|nr:HAD-IA family hydrolase [Aquificota bacterium]